MGTHLVTKPPASERSTADGTMTSLVRLLGCLLVLSNLACTVEERLPPLPDAGANADARNPSDAAIDRVFDAWPDGDGDTTCIVDGRRCHDGYPEAFDGTTWQSLGSCDMSTPYCYCGACLGCQPGSHRCVGSALEQCSTTGEWTSQATCSGATPVCNAQTGACASTRLVGGFSTLGPAGPPASGARVVGGELLLLPPICNATKNACIQGGFVP